MKIFIVGILALSSSVVLADAPKGIYGEDNRVDVYASPNASFREMARSTAAMFEGGAIKKNFLSKYYDIKSGTLEERGVCKVERFSDQQTASSCSGFLVAPNKIVTAGHCIKHQADCATYKWVFDYQMSAQGGKIKIPENSVYDCKKLIARQKTATNDFALIELDRPVLDRSPLKLRQSGKVSVGDELVIIGNPSGLPTKIADGAKVRSVAPDFFVSNLDSYGGNSGSAVINVKTEEVEGILVRGGTDYERRGSGGCARSVLCGNDKCEGESSTHIINVGPVI